MSARRLPTRASQGRRRRAHFADGWNRLEAARDRRAAKLRLREAQGRTRLAGMGGQGDQSSREGTEEEGEGEGEGEEVVLDVSEC